MNSSTLLLMAALLLVFWLLVLRPARTRQRKAQELQSSISVGDEVMTGSGIFGTVVAEDEERLQLEVAPGVAIWFLRPAVSRKIEPEPAPDGPDASHDEIKDDAAGSPADAGDQAGTGGSAPSAEAAAEPSSTRDAESLVGDQPEAPGSTGGSAK